MDTTKYDITLAIERLFYFKRDVRKGVFPFITPISGVYNKKEFFQVQTIFSATALLMTFFISDY